MGLLERYLSGSGDSTLMSQKVKKSVQSGTVDDTILDSYLMMFQEVFDFYSSRLKDKALLEMLKKNLYLKINPQLSRYVGIKDNKNIPYKVIVMFQYAKAWQWKIEKITDLDNFDNWDFNKVMEFWDSVKKFIPLPHRLEYIGEINGIRCFNDSKATNPDATIKALEHFKKEVTLILGGLDKGMSFKSLIPVLNKKVCNLILIGSCKDLLFDVFSAAAHDYKIFKAVTLNEAINKAFNVTEKGNVFLLSPSCASMDMFKDYKDRGEQFKKLVLAFKL